MSEPTKPTAGKTFVPQEPETKPATMDDVLRVARMVRDLLAEQTKHLAEVSKHMTYHTEKYKQLHGD